MILLGKDYMDLIISPPITSVNNYGAPHLGPGW